jgi:hypothetical protein
MSSLYRVTDTAPPRVNGVRARPGDLMTLSAAAALYERDLGHIVETPRLARSTSRTPSEPLCR